MKQWHNDLASTLSLDGQWQFQLGEQSGSIYIPGTWEAQGYPRDLEGPAVYQRTIHIPAEWDGQTIQLQFDAVSYHIEIKINGKEIATHIGMWTAFAIDITETVHIGHDNDFQLTVYKPGTRFPLRETLAGFLPDVCLPFGGVWQSARLVAFRGTAVSDLHLQAVANSGTTTVKAHLHNAIGLTALVHISAPDGTIVGQSATKITGTVFATDFKIEEVLPWGINQPNRYHVKIQLVDENNSTAAEVEQSFGFRSLSHQGDQLLLNNQPVFLRGILNWGWYPEILCPAPDETTIREEFRRIRAFGYNMVKLCLYVPSPLYFEIADEEGMLLWLELPMWLPEVSEQLRQQAPREYTDILATVHHHPSIIIYSLGCELGAAVDNELLEKLNGVLREHVSNVLFCDNSGSGEAYGGLAFDYADFNDYHFYADLHYFNPLLDHFRRDWRPARPWIFGEFCDADDYRDLGEVARLHQGTLPWWLIEHNPIHKLSALAYSQQAPRMAALDIPFDEQALQRISRQQSFVVRKTILEKVRAKSNMGGYVVTSIRETPLATSSMFDELGRDKYDTEQFQQFNTDKVLVLEQGRARVWKHGGDRPAPTDRNNYVSSDPMDFRIVVSHAAGHLAAGMLHWQIVDTEDRVLDRGDVQFEAKPPQHTPVELASIYLTAPKTTKAQQFTLKVNLGSGIKNSWPLWVYPKVSQSVDSVVVYDPSGLLDILDNLTASAKRTIQLSNIDTPVLITSVFTSEVYDYVRGGGKVVVLQSTDGILPVKAVPFWRESIKLLYTHPILLNFPHQNYVDLQFYHLATDYAVDTERVLSVFRDVQEVKPIIRRLDARQFTLLDYLVEYTIGSGTVIVSSLSFGGGAGDQVNGLSKNVAGHYLLYLILEYLMSQ